MNRRLISVLLPVLLGLLGSSGHLKGQTSASFGSGPQIIGADIAAGSYRSQGGDGCYWERLSGFGGTIGEIIANANPRGPAVVTIAPTDAGFNSDGCSTWTQGLSAITASVDDPFGDGTFVVNTDISPGTWRSQGGGSCYWARLSGFGGTTGEIIANANTGSSAIVTLSASDAGFTSNGCGTWSKTAAPAQSMQPAAVGAASATAPVGSGSVSLIPGFRLITAPGVQIQVPSDWQSVEFPRSSYRVLQKSPDGAVTLGVALISSDPATARLDLDQFLIDENAEPGSGSSNLHVVTQPKQQVVAGADNAAYSSATFTYKGRSLASFTLVATRGSSLYSFIAIMGIDKLDQYGPIVLQILSTLQLTP